MQLKCIECLLKVRKVLDSSLQREAGWVGMNENEFYGGSVLRGICTLKDFNHSSKQG